MQAKEILARLAGEIGFEIELIDLDHPTGQALAARHGVLFAPGVLIDGRLATYGRPSERRLRCELTRAAANGER